MSGQSIFGKAAGVLVGIFTTVSVFQGCNKTLRQDPKPEKGQWVKEWAFNSAECAAENVVAIAKGLISGGKKEYEKLKEENPETLDFSK